MNFSADSGVWGAMFGIPCIVADNFLKLATGDQLKVLVYLLRNSGRACSDEEISLNTGVPADCVADAVMFWQQANVLKESSPCSIQNSSIMSVPSAPVAVKPVADNPPKTDNPTPKPEVTARKRVNLTPSEISACMRDSAEITQLFKMAESCLGTLNHTQQNSLIWIYTYLGLKIEVIITLLSYCISIDKTNSSYIEKIAFSWSENEINTLEIAQEEVCRLNASHDFTSRIMKCFEMKRKPTTKQAERIAEWQSIGFNIELIHYAYEKTIEQIDKLNFEYINKILISWRDSGFATVADVKNAEESFRDKKNNEASSTGDDFDVDKYKIFVNNF